MVSVAMQASIAWDRAGSEWMLTFTANSGEELQSLQLSQGLVGLSARVTGTCSMRNTANSSVMPFSGSKALAVSGSLWSTVVAGRSSWACKNAVQGAARSAAGCYNALTASLEQIWKLKLVVKPPCASPHPDIVAHSAPADQHRQQAFGREPMPRQFQLSLLCLHNGLCSFLLGLQMGHLQ